MAKKKPFPKDGIPRSKRFKPAIVRGLPNYCGTQTPYGPCPQESYGVGACKEHSPQPSTGRSDLIREMFGKELWWT